MECHTQGVNEYFEIEYHTRGSRSIFLLTAACGNLEVISNSMSHAGGREYFQIDCCTRVSISFFFFKLTIALRCPRGSRHHGNRLYGVMELWSKMFDWVSGVEWKPLRLL